MDTTTASQNQSSDEKIVESMTTFPQDEAHDSKTKEDMKKLQRTALNNDWNTAYRDVFKEDPLKYSNYLIARTEIEGKTLLHSATEAKSFLFVTELIKYLTEDQLTIKDSHGNTAFFVAASKGRVKFAKVMFEKNEQLPSIRGNFEMLPIHVVAQNGHRQMTEFLYKIHGPLEEIDNNRLFLNVMSRVSLFDDPRINESLKKLYKAASDNDWDTAHRDVFEGDVSKNSKYLTARISDKEDTALHIAAWRKSFTFVEELIKHMRKEDLAIKNRDGNTAFFLVAASGNVRLALQMYEKNLELPSIHGDKEMLPIHRAAQQGQTKMVNFLYGIQEPLQEIDDKKLSVIEIKRRNRHFELYQAALKGDWNTAERIYDEDNIDIPVKLSKDGGTALHIAAAARHTGFVEKLLDKMNEKDLEVKNKAGNTAFFLAAASERVEIVKAMMKKNKDMVKIRGDKDMLPLHKAALMGDEEMVEYLYGATEDKILDHDNDRIELLISLINQGLYDIALKLVQKHPELATARDKNEEIALHSLARMPVLKRVLDLSLLMLARTLIMYFKFVKYMMEHIRNELDWRDLMKVWMSCMSRIYFTGEETPQSAFELIKRLWEQIMLLDDSKILEIIRKPPALIFEATKHGNLAFLKIIFGAYPDLIFEVDEKNHSIFHSAVLYRHRKIFKIIHENESFRDWVVQNTDEQKNILRVAAKLPPSDRPNVESGVALQLREELLCFKEVNKILHPLDAGATNEARALFTEEHKALKDYAERWIKDTVNSCLVAATIVASVAFAAAFTVPGGDKEETRTPHFSRRAPFIIFAISDAIALMLSTLSILRFLSVISSRYAEEDFISRLTSSLIGGLAALSLSITAMMVVFCTTMFIVFKDGMLWIPILVTVMACIVHSVGQEKFKKIMDDLVCSKNDSS